MDKQLTPEQKGSWIKVAEGMPLEEGMYRVKRAYLDTEEKGYFNGIQFTNYDGYRVIKWYNSLTSPIGDKEK